MRLHDLALRRPAGRGCSRSRSRLHPSPASGSRRPAGREDSRYQGATPTSRSAWSNTPSTISRGVGRGRRLGRSVATNAKARSNCERARPPPAGPTAGRRAPIRPMCRIHRPAWQSPDEPASVDDQGEGPSSRPAISPCRKRLQPLKSFEQPLWIGDWSRLLQGEWAGPLKCLSRSAGCKWISARISPPARRRGLAALPSGNARCVDATREPRVPP